MIALDTPVSGCTFVSVDVETTGLDPKRDVIVEIGAVKFCANRTIDEFSTLIYIDRTIPLEARRVHGISNEMLIGKPRIAEAMALFRDFAEDAPLVEHSFKSFDAGFLDAANGSEWPGPYINTCTFSRKLFPFHRSHSLAECCRRHNIVNDSAHRALSDARATARLLSILLEAAGARYPHLQTLIEACSIERAGADSRRSPYGARTRRGPSINR